MCIRDREGAVQYFDPLALRLLGDLGQLGEGGGVVDSHLRQHLPVDLNASDLQAVHEGGGVPVSYTHLDVYKRQMYTFGCTVLPVWPT